FFDRPPFQEISLDNLENILSNREPSAISLFAPDRACPSFLVPIGFYSERFCECPNGLVLCEGAVRNPAAGVSNKRIVKIANTPIEVADHPLRKWITYEAHLDIRAEGAHRIVGALKHLPF